MAQALYSPAAPPEQLALFGLSAVDLDETIEILPDNWPAFIVMEAMGTQWRTGMGGASGLDYAVVPAVMSLVNIPKKTRNQVFHDLRVMEAEALLVMSESK
ncbi:DUF1799 domain-containing protein [Pseudomonas putida]|uniref:DUF1799 domain-containing protein n=1 Tax=Pseudomonas putida TaxID=303 RepID=UPI0023636DC6|nr:DUF1799 domain-containing protein [Pseudomonas putida]MDD1966192.1 DUF1799 domain-containing protein [Pseudomonas putida]